MARTSRSRWRSLKESSGSSIPAVAFSAALTSDAARSPCTSRLNGRVAQFLEHFGCGGPRRRQASCRTAQRRHGMPVLCERGLRQRRWSIARRVGFEAAVAEAAAANADIPPLLPMQDYAIPSSHRSELSGPECARRSRLRTLREQHARVPALAHHLLDRGERVRHRVPRVCRCSKVDRNGNRTQCTVYNKSCKHCKCRGATLRRSFPWGEAVSYGTHSTLRLQVPTDAHRKHVDACHPSA